MGKSLTDAFSLVAASRNKKMGGLFSSFTPLPQEKVIKLQNLLKDALENDAQVQENFNIKTAVLAALVQLIHYKDEPEKITSPVYGNKDGRIMTDPLDVDKAHTIGYNTYENPERPKILKNMQRSLYKDLKKHL